MKDFKSNETAKSVNARSTNEGAEFGSESDIVSFWLLLLFVAVFFGVAAEEAQGPIFRTSAIRAQSPMTISDVRNAAAHDFDLSSRSRPEKTEVPATGK